MVSTNDIRPGQSILLDGTLYLILEYQHVKPGKGKAFVKTKLKNLSSGGVVDNGKMKYINLLINNNFNTCTKMVKAIYL